MKEKIFQALKERYIHTGLEDSTFRKLSEVLTAADVVTEENLSSIIEKQDGTIAALCLNVIKERLIDTPTV